MDKLEADVFRKAKALSMKWTTNGQKVDSDDFFAAINDVHEAICAFYQIDPKVGFTMQTETVV